VTLPEAVVRAARVTEGDRFVVEVTADDPDTILLHRIRASYAGTLADLYGDLDAYLQEERRSWER
jgi:antitoxin component of MazEF toxin-antitoxin module